MKILNNFLTVHKKARRLFLTANTEYNTYVSLQSKNKFIELKVSSCQIFQEN